MLVGYNSNSYLAQRNIINIVNLHSYKQVYDINYFFRASSSIIKKIIPALKINNTIDKYYKFNDYNLNRVDLLHFYNAISFGNTPWITTFETIAPRYENTLRCHQGKDCTFAPLVNDKKVHKALKALSSDSCIKLIAMSECNYKMQKSLLGAFPQFRSEIEHKLTFIHPPQKLYIENYQDKVFDINGPIHFMFIGSSFFRKGGMEMLNAFQDAKKVDKCNLKLTIISSLTIDSYATKETKEDVRRARGLIYENREWINHFDFLPNQQALRLMKTVHVGLLPTYADTYGFSVLEFQASGCPVITTDVRALPEINNDTTGWIIEVPKNHLNEAVYTNSQERAEISQKIRNGLKKIVTEICNNPRIIERKASAAIERIITQHAPEDYAKKVNEIYQVAIKDN